MNCRICQTEVLRGVNGDLFCPRCLTKAEGPVHPCDACGLKEGWIKKYNLDWCERCWRIHFPDEASPMLPMP